MRSIFLTSLIFHRTLSQGPPEACCWCGKKYEPLPGYWEGAGAVAAKKRIEVVFSADLRTVGVVIPEILRQPEQHLVVTSGDGSIILDRSLPQQDDTAVLTQHFHSFALPVLDHGEKRQQHFTAQVRDSKAGHVLYQREAAFANFTPPPSAPQESEETIFPFGWFINYGGWLMQKNKANGKEEGSVEGKLRGREMGSVGCPVSPFEPGGLAGLEAALASAAPNSWIFDLQHVSFASDDDDGNGDLRDEHADNAGDGTVGSANNSTQAGGASSRSTLSSLRATVKHFRNHPALKAWYIADEPDGAGDLPGLPVGFHGPQQVRQAYRLVKELDPHHPVLLSLNCLRSSSFYRGASDVLLLDPYPIGVNLNKGCNATYGCNGCDGCAHGGVLDVGERMATARHDLLQTGGNADDNVDGGGGGGGRGGGLLPPTWAVLQAFGGGGGHWERAPGEDELRASVALAVAHGASGVLLWLREGGTSPELVHTAELLLQELSTLSPWLLRGKRRLLSPYVFDQSKGRSVRSQRQHGSQPTRVPTPPLLGVETAQEVEVALWALPTNGGTNGGSFGAGSQRGGGVGDMRMGKGGGRRSVLVVAVNPSSFSRARFQVPGLSGHIEAGATGSTGGFAATGEAVLGAGSMSGSNADKAGDFGEIEASLLFHSPPKSVRQKRQATLRWEVVADILQGELPPLATAAFLVQIGNGDGENCEVM